ncbi:MAG: PrsW family intrarane metalloprotease [Microbacteriaceae bacterium]|jgi:RsiW-degrading membrane proteinase PrsW (M82 family)|nr:PrsW family intrarane metalloprotease [Microbacteriaceae bacterium]
MTALQAPITRTHRHGWWWKALLVGLGLWAASIVVTAVTLNSNLIPTLILIGSFLVPLCVVLFAAERITGTMTGTTIVLVFFLSGVFGVLGASLLEDSLVPSVLTYFLVGFIEEFVKAAILVIVGWRLVPKTAGQGALLGATVGAGFAAFESAGYAFNAALTSQGINLVSLLQTEVLRAVLAPVGHVLWTAIFGAVWFGAARGRSRLRFAFAAIGAYVAVAILHGLWDSMSGFSTFLAVLLTGNLVRVEQFGFLPPGSAAAVSALAITVYVIGLVVIAVLGLLTLRLCLRHYRAREARSPQVA